MNFREYAESIEALITALGIVIGGGWVLRRYVFRKEDFPRIEMSVDINFVGRQQGQWIVEILCFLKNKGLVPYAIRSLRFNLRALSSSDDLVQGGPDINFQLLFDKKIKKAAWTPANTEVAAIIHPGVSMRYNYIYMFPETASFVLLHGILDYGKHGLQTRADRVLKVPEIANNDTQT